MDIKKNITLTIRRPDDWHVHFRESKMLKTVVPFTSKFFGRAIVMPNLACPVTNIKIAEIYKKQIIEASNSDHLFYPLMTFQLTDNTNLNELIRGFNSGLFVASKFYFSNITTNSNNGVSNINNIYHVLREMEYIGMPLLVHAELSKNNIDIFDREVEFINQIIKPLRLKFPRLKIVIEHITSIEAVRYILDGNEFIAATITPHHLMFNRNKMFVNGINPHFYCLPLLKKKKHQDALRSAVVSGCNRFFLGTDTAPHFKSCKESSFGSSGIFNAPTALIAYITVFEELNALKYFESFCSFNGPNFYNLPINKEYIMFTKKDNVICKSIICDNDEIIPFLAGEKVSWFVSVVN